MSATIWGMGAWLKDLWEQIRGSAKWEGIRFVLGVCVTPLLLAVVAYLRHAPWPVWMFLVLFAQMTIVLPLYVMDTRKRQREIENRNRSVVAEPRLRLKLIPHGDNDTSIYLEVLNQGDAITLSAQLGIIGRNPSKLFKTRVFDGQWKSALTTIDFYNERAESYVGDVRIEPNKSRLLTVASIVSMTGFDEQEMALVGIDDESIVWGSDPRKGHELPYFIIWVTLVGKGYKDVVNATYKVGPKTHIGPLQMMEVVV
jgi:hypothetical protein